LLHERLKEETDRGLQMAYASALGNLKATEAIETLFDLLRDTDNEGARMEVALALGRIIGDEAHFVRLLRQVRDDAGTAVAQELIQLKNHLEKSASSELMNVLAVCSEAFARENLDEGIEQLVGMIRALPSSAYFTEMAETLLSHCANALEVCGAARIEYLILTLHVLHSGAR
jgi:HEAT repeat protein